MISYLCHCCLQSARAACREWTLAAAALSAVMVWSGFSGPVGVEEPALEQQIVDIRKMAAKNRMELAGYTWRQQETVTLKDKVEDQKLFQVESSPGGKLQRVPLDLPQENFPGPGKDANRGLHEWIVEKHQRALQTYVRELKDLAEKYSDMDTDLLRLAYDRGDVRMDAPPAGGGARLTARNYVKPQDAVKLVFDPKSSQVESLQASSYMGSAKEPVEISVDFQISDGEPGHVAEIRATAPKRKLAVILRNMEYQRASARDGPRGARCFPQAAAIITSF